MWDQLARALAFVADRGGLGRSDDLAGQRVALGQAGDTVAAQDATDRTGRHCDQVGQAIWSLRVIRAGRHHLRLDLGRGLGGCPVRPAGAIQQAARPFGPVTVDPPVRALTRDPPLLGHMRDRAPVMDDALDLQSAAMNVQPGVSVGHETSGGRWCRRNHHRTGGLSHDQANSPTVTNVLAEYI
jgi:hypothetical protein